MSTKVPTPLWTRHGLYHQRAPYYPEKPSTAAQLTATGPSQGSPGHGQVTNPIPHPHVHNVISSQGAHSRHGMKNKVNQARVNNVNTGRGSHSGTANQAITRNSFNLNYQTSNLRKGIERIPLNILSTNAQGLYSKFVLLSATIEDEYPDIITITETWLDSTITDAEFTPRGTPVSAKIGTHQTTPNTHTLTREEVECSY